MQPLFDNTAIWSKEATEEIFSVAHKADRIVFIVGGLVLLCVGAADVVTGAAVCVSMMLIIWRLGKVPWKSLLRMLRIPEVSTS